MIKFVRNFALLGLVAAGALLANPSPAHAVFTLSLTDGTTTKTATDGGAGDLDNTLNGQIVFSGVVGNFETNLTTSISNSASGVAPAQITINDATVDTLSPTGGTLTITTSDTGFTAPTGQAVLTSQLSNTQILAGTGTASTNTITFQSFLNGAGGPTITETGVSGLVGASSNVFIGATPFELSNVTTINFTTAGTVQITGITTATTPEPATVAMVITALPVLGLGYLRRRRAQA
jgi:hypothetical protein